MARLTRSLAELRIGLPMPLPALSVVLHETVRRNRVRNGIVYLQITRGVARRDFAFPAPATAPSIVVTARSHDTVKAENTAAEGIAVITLADKRWARPDIKSVSLLPNVLAKQAARDAGAREAWFVDGRGFVTEGASSNAWIITADGEVVTRPADSGGFGCDGSERAYLHRTTVHRRGSEGSPGSLYNGCKPDRAAGGEHRRKASRRGASWAGRPRIAAAISPPCGIYLTLELANSRKKRELVSSRACARRCPTF